MTKLGKLWTESVAYVSLATAAGVSMAGNLADTYRTRGGQVDTLDKALAIVWPLFVILAIEMFVSQRWKRTPLFQVWRWVGCLAIGGMAMTVSWTHLHDLMASRGQLAIVASLGPLAIDGMAVMATGLILSTRGHMAMATEMATKMATRGHGLAIFGHEPVAADGEAVATGGEAVATAEEVATARMARAEQATELTGHGHEPGQPYVTMVDEDRAVATQPLSEEYAATLRAEVDAWGAGVDQAITDAGQELATETEIVVAKVPDEAVAMIRAWDPKTMAKEELDASVAERFGRSLRTARRWRSLVTGQPTSGGR